MTKDHLTCISANLCLLNLGFLYKLLCSFRKYPYSPHRRDRKFLGGGESPKTKKFKEMYVVELEFPEGWGGSYKKSLPWGRYGYFMELHIDVRYIEVVFHTFYCNFGWVEEFYLLYRGLH